MFGDFSLKLLRRAELDLEELEAAAILAAKNRRKTGQVKSTKPEGLYDQVSKCLAMLKNNPRHPGLQTHEYKSMEHPFEKDAKVFEAYAQNRTPSAYRVFWCYGPGRKEITILSIAPHP